MVEIFDYQYEEMEDRAQLLFKRCPASNRLFNKYHDFAAILDIILKKDGSCQKLQSIEGDPCPDCRLNGIIESPSELLKKPEPFEKIAKGFPLEVIPEPFRTFCEEAARCSNCAVDNVALPLLAYWSGIVGNRQYLEVVPGWQEFCNIWIITIGEPSTMKSTGRQKSEFFTNALIKKAWSIYEYEVLEWEKIEEKDRGRKPKLKRYLVSNTTMEALDYILHENPSGGIVWRNDELTSLLRSLNQYKNKGADRSNLLDLWDSKIPRIIDRKLCDPVIVNNPFVSIVGSIVPSFLDELRSYGKEDGLTTRFLFGFPKKEVLHFSYDNFISPDIIKEVGERFEWMDTVSIDDTKTACFFSEESGSRPNFQTWLNDVHYPQEQDKDVKPEIAMQLGKLRSYVVRLSLLFHTMQEANDGILSQIVTNKSLQSAITLVDEYFKSSIEKTFGIISKTQLEVKAEFLLNWMWKKSEGKMAVFKISWIQQHYYFDRLKLKADIIKELLSILQNLGYGFILTGNDFLIFEQYIIA
jgi:hypothetical protein